MEQLISKKELLEEMGITYGQLYRWKRKKILPEDWFIKKSSFTGQETFFPREKVMKRISLIKEMKNKYSLDELAEFFTSGKKQKQNVEKNDLKNSHYFLPDVIDFFEKATFEYSDLVKVAMVDYVARKEIMDNSQRHNLLHILEKCDMTKYNFKLIKLTDEKSYFIMHQEDATVAYDTRVKVEEIYSSYLAKDKVNKFYEGL